MNWSKNFQLTWDGWNRLVEVKGESGDPVANYEYDALTRRIVREVASSGEIREIYYNNQWRPVEERVETISSSSSSGSGSSVSSASSVSLSSSSFISSSSSSSIGSSSSSSVGSISSVGDSAERQYLWGIRYRDDMVRRDRDTDDSGSFDESLYVIHDYYNPTAVVNASGVVQERYAYSAFGIRSIMDADFAARSTSSFDWDFAFQGQFEDGETGYLNYGFRYYSPQLGRFVNRDPIEEEGGNALYVFAMNSPINGVDSLGLEFQSGVFNEKRYTVDKALLDGARAAIHSTAIYQREHPGFHIEYGGTVCSYYCVEDNEIFILVSELAVGTPVRAVSTFGSVAVPVCPEHWKLEGRFHSQPSRVLPSGTDASSGDPGVVGAPTGPGQGQTIAFKGAATDDAIDFEFDQNATVEELRNKYKYIAQGLRMEQVSCPCSCPTCEWSQG